jgi:hypothetical protein
MLISTLALLFIHSRVEPRRERGETQGRNDNTESRHNLGNAVSIGELSKSGGKPVVAPRPVRRAGR